MGANRHQHDPEPLSATHTRKSRHAPRLFKGSLSCVSYWACGAAADGALKANSVHVRRSPSLKYF